MNDDAVRDARFSGLMKANKDTLCAWLEVIVCLTENCTTTDPQTAPQCSVLGSGCRSGTEGRVDFWVK